VVRAPAWTETEDGRLLVVILRYSWSPLNARNSHCAPATVPAFTRSPDPGNTMSSVASATRLSWG